MTSLPLPTTPVPVFIRTKPAPPVRLTNQPASRQLKSASFRDSVKLQNEITRPNPFLISDEELNDRGFIEKKYGENGDVIRVYGKLRERDRQTMITLLQMCKELGKSFYVKVSDIAKAEGSKNPYSESTLGPIRESLDRLLIAEIRINLIRPSREKKSRAKFIFLHGGVGDDDNYRLNLSDYLDTCDEFKCGFFFIKPSIYRALGGDIAKALYCFLQSQQFIFRGGVYELRLSKLCQYINYNPAGSTRSGIWRNIYKALKQLSEKGVIGEYSRNTDKHRREGGLLSIHGPSKQPVALKSESNPYGEIAQRLAKIKKITPQPRVLKGWAKDIKKLDIKCGIVPERINKALNWYEDNHEKRTHIPVISSGKDLFDKFTQLEAAVKRHKIELLKGFGCNPSDIDDSYLANENLSYAGYDPDKYEYEEKIKLAAPVRNNPKRIKLRMINKEDEKYFEIAEKYLDPKKFEEINVIFQEYKKATQTQDQLNPSELIEAEAKFREGFKKYDSEIQKVEFMSSVLSPGDYF